MNLIAKLNVLKSFGLEVLEAEENVYHVVNHDKVINIRKLQEALEESMMVVSCTNHKYITNKDGYDEPMDSIYYIFLTCDVKTETITKYWDLADENDTCTVVVFKNNPNHMESIDILSAIRE